MLWQRTWLLILNKANAYIVCMVTVSFLLVSRKRELLVSGANYRESSGSLYRKVATPCAIQYRAIFPLVVYLILNFLTS